MTKTCSLEMYFVVEDLWNWLWKDQTYPYCY